MATTTHSTRSTTDSHTPHAASSHPPSQVSSSITTTTTPDNLFFGCDQQQQPHPRTLPSSRSASASFDSGTRSAPTTPSLQHFPHTPLSAGAAYFRGYTLSPSSAHSAYTYEQPPRSAPAAAGSSFAAAAAASSSTSPVSPTGDAPPNHRAASRSVSPSAPSRAKSVSSPTSSPLPIPLHTLPPAKAASYSAVGCPYETALMNSRRRVPYSLGASPLGSPHSRILERLPSAEEAHLTASIEKLYDELLPSEESSVNRRKLINKLEKLLNEEWPGKSIRVLPFGSTENMLCSNSSDVDVCIVTDYKKLEDTCMLSRFWANHNMERVVCVPGAKVPIVKIWDPEFEFSCDMNLNNPMALENTKMVKTYVQIDPRVRPLAMIIKHWAKQRALNDAAGGGTLSSYSWICLIINFLQLRSPPILPSLHKIGNDLRQEKIVNGVDISFCDDLTLCNGFGNKNKETLGGLLFAFFKWYAIEFDYDRDVVSVRQGRLLTKAEKHWDTLQNNRFCIEEPLSTLRNLGNTVDDISAKGIFLEFRRAYDILVNEGSLSKCCEKFEFPNEEHHFLASNSYSSSAPAAAEMGLGLSFGSIPPGRLSRRASQSSYPARPFPRGGSFRAQSYRKGGSSSSSISSTGSSATSTGISNYTTAKNGGLPPGGKFPPPPAPMYGMSPSEYMMPVFMPPAPVPQAPPPAAGAAPIGGAPSLTASLSSSPTPSHASTSEASDLSTAPPQAYYMYYPPSMMPMFYQPPVQVDESSAILPAAPTAPAAVAATVDNTGATVKSRARSLSPSHHSNRKARDHSSFSTASGGGDGYVHAGYFAAQGQQARSGRMLQRPSAQVAPKQQQQQRQSNSHQSHQGHQNYHQQQHARYQDATRRNGKAYKGRHQSSEDSSSDLSDISPETHPNSGGCPPATPPDCRLDGFMKGRAKYGESEYDEEEDGENTMTMSGGESDGAAADTLRRMQQVSKQVKERVKVGQARPLKANEGRANDGRKWVRAAAAADDGQNGSRRTGSLDESGKLKSYADAVMDQNRSTATSGQTSAAARVAKGGRPALATADAEDDGDFWAVGGSSASTIKTAAAPVSTNAATKIVVAAGEGARGDEGSVAVPNQWTTSTSKRRNKKKGGVRQEEVEVMKGG